MKYRILTTLYSAALLLASLVQAESRPNILFIIADDASLGTFGAYGGTMIETPGFDRLAREGVLFTNAYNCNPKCGPARSCLVTGRYSWQLGEATNHQANFPPEFVWYPPLVDECGLFYRIDRQGLGPWKVCG